MATTRHMKILTHLWYAKEADEAAKLYASIFPDSRVDQVVSLPSETPSGPAGSVKIVNFTLFGQPFRAMSAGPHHDFNDSTKRVTDAMLKMVKFDIATLERAYRGDERGEP